MAILLADIGGTNARFRWFDKGQFGKLTTYSCDDFKNPMALIDLFINDVPQKLNGIVVAGAGPLQKGKLQWTNRPTWKISKKDLGKKYHVKNVVVINDVQAQGEGLKQLYRCQKASILMNAGTGLGGCFIFNNQVLAGEVGQIKIDQNTKIEDVISASGVVRLYHVLGGKRNIKSARIIDQLRSQKDTQAQQAYQTFYQKWGEFAARLATAFYALGGIYLWGSLVPVNKKDKNAFLKAYQATLPKALHKIPVRFVRFKNLAFKGLARLSDREFSES